jgi:hypothetical protein
MLNEFQINKVWENMLNAETRALYFGDLATRYTRRKQWITGLSFFLSSGAAATIIGKSPGAIPVTLSLLVAGLTAYSMALNLDGKIIAMARFHSAWSRIASEYDRLWNHAYDPDAELRFERIIEQEREPSELATTEAPNDQRLLGKWQHRVFDMYHLNTGNG